MWAVVVGVSGPNNAYLVSAWDVGMRADVRIAIAIQCGAFGHTRAVYLRAVSLGSSALTGRCRKHHTSSQLRPQLATETHYTECTS